MLTLLVLKVPNYLSKLGGSIKDVIQGSWKVSVEAGRFGSNCKSGWYKLRDRKLLRYASWAIKLCPVLSKKKATGCDTRSHGMQQTTL